MLSVSVHKDVAEYKPKIIGKLTARTLIAISGALGFSTLAGLYVYFVLGLNVSEHTWIIYAASLPFWLVGFYQPKGMPFEVWLPYYLRYSLSDNKILYAPSAVLIGYMGNENGKPKRRIYKNEYRKFTRRKGIESYSPRTGSV